MPGVLSPVSYEAIKAVLVLSGGSSSPALQRFPEAATQTFNYGVPTYLNAGFVTEANFGTAISVLGVSSEPGHNLTSAGVAEQTSVGDDRLRRAVLQDWLEGLRMVTTDGVAQRRAIDRVYAHIASGTNAQAFISEFYRNDPPFKRAQTGSVSVEVKSVLPTSDRSFEIDWIETSRDLYGNVNSTDHWKGSFTVALNPPTEERQARINPLGLYVTAASWAKVL